MSSNNANVNVPKQPAPESVSVIYAPLDDNAHPNSPAQPMIRDDRFSKSLIEVPKLPVVDEIGDLLFNTELKALTVVSELDAFRCIIFKRGGADKATHVFEQGRFDLFCMEDLGNIAFSYNLVIDEDGNSASYKLVIAGMSNNVDCITITYSALARALCSAVAQRNMVGEQLVSSRRIAQVEKQSIMQESNQLRKDAAMWKDVANKNKLLHEGAAARLNIATAAFDTAIHPIRLYAGEGSWAPLEGEDVSRVLIGNMNGYQLAQHVLNDVIVKEMLDA
jgi:hypothetical protein